MCVRFSLAGKLLASGSMDFTVRLWDVESGEEIRCLRGHSWPGYSLAFSPDGKTLASGAREVILWNLTTGEKVQELPRIGQPIDVLCFSPSPAAAVTTAEDKPLRLAAGSRDSLIRIYT